MIIKVGSLNVVKVSAVKEIIKEYDFLRGADVIGMDVDSGVGEQPKTLEETIRGARNRAKNCFCDCEFSFGIEGGITEIPYTISGYMNIEVCAAFNGKDFFIGLASGFESPPKAIDLIVRKGFDMSEAYYSCGLTDNPNLGSKEGAIGLLTKGRLNRKGYTKQAITTALIYLENKGM